jgi:hypothetical protein
MLKQKIKEVFNTLKNSVHFKDIPESEFYGTFRNISKKTEYNTELEKEIHFRLKNDNKLWTIFLNCQKSKTAQVIKRLKEINNTKTVSIIMCQNDSQLALQTSERINNELTLDTKVFVLTSAVNRKPNYDDDSIVYNPKIADLLKYVLNYLTGKTGYLYPVIVGLTNYLQIEKVIAILEATVKLPDTGYHLFFDEADATYHNLRPKLLKFIMTDDVNTHTHNKGTYWITATGFSLINGVHSYKECKIAHQYDIQISDFIKNNYFGINDDNAVIHKIDNKDDKLFSIIQSNIEHFTKPLNDGTYRRIIGISSFVTDDQIIDAIGLKNVGFNVISINSKGLLLHNKDSATVVLTQKFKEFNKSLAHLYHQSIYSSILKSKPLIILGNRKVDRGLTFHYAPDENSKIPPMLWTDIVIPQTENWKRAVQMTGRVAGIIKHISPFKEIHYWIETKTLKRIEKYVSITDNIYIEVPLQYKTIEEIIKQVIAINKE